MKRILLLVVDRREDGLAFLVRITTCRLTVPFLGAEQLQRLLFLLGKIVWRDHSDEIRTALAQKADGHTHLVALGKAASGVGRLARDMPFASRMILGVKGYGEGAMYYGGHPQLNAQSLQAGAHLQNWMARIPAGDRLCAFVSGGGSASVDQLSPALTRTAALEWWQDLMAVGLPIRDLNRVRSLVSTLKNGQLSEQFQGSVHVIVQQDIGGHTDAWRFVSGGHFVSLTWPRNPPLWLTDLPSLDGLDFHRAWESACQKSFVPEYQVLQSPDRLAGQIVADLERQALLAGAKILQQDFLDGDVSEAIQKIVSYCADPGVVSVVPSETVVKVKGSGRGGRLTELLLHANLCLPAGWYLFAAASDGVDGSSGISGGIVCNGLFGTTATRDALDQSDSGTLLKSLPVYCPARASGANLCDQLVLLHQSVINLNGLL